MGSPDPRLDQFGNVDFRLSRQLRGYKKEDPPPSRVKPIPIAVLHCLARNARVSGNPETEAICAMIVLAFFFLLRPGEYTAPSPESQPFLLQDVTLYVGTRPWPAHRIPLNLLPLVSFVTLTFTNQKNAVRGECIGHGLSLDYLLCPVKSVVSQVRHLRTHDATATTPLCTFYNRKSRCVTPSMITTTLKATVQQLSSQLGFLASDVSARSLRAGGAMALLCAHVETDTIRLIGRWRSDELMRYLHVQAQPVMKDYSRRMVAGGDYALHHTSEAIASLWLDDAAVGQL